MYRVGYTVKRLHGLGKDWVEDGEAGWALDEVARSCVSVVQRHRVARVEAVR